MYQESIKIPKDRVAVLIGTKGSDKRLIEKQAKVKLDIDSKEGDVIISGEDNFQVFLTRNIIKAIARGFSPRAALELLQDNYILELIDIQDYSGKSKNKLTRLKSRIIGSQGKARKTIQGITNTNIVIYGKTIAIIGEAEAVIQAKKGIEILLRGSKHGSVYFRLERGKERNSKD